MGGKILKLCCVLLGLFLSGGEDAKKLAFASSPHWKDLALVAVSRRRRTSGEGIAIVSF